MKISRTFYCFFAYFILWQIIVSQQGADFWPSQSSRQEEWVGSAYEIQVQVTKSTMQTASNTIFLRVEWIARNLTKAPIKINWTKNLVYCGACSGEAGKTLLFPFSSGTQKSELQPGETSATLWAEYQLSPCFVEGSGMSYMYWGQFDTLKNKFIYRVRLKPENPGQKKEMQEKGLYLTSESRPETKDWLSHSYYGRQGEWITLTYRAKKEDARMEPQCKILIENSYFWISDKTMHIRVEWKIQNLSNETKSYSWENKHLFIVGTTSYNKFFTHDGRKSNFIPTAFEEFFAEFVFFAPLNGIKAVAIPPQSISPTLWNEFQVPFYDALFIDPRHDTYSYSTIEKLNKVLDSNDKAQIANLFKRIGWGLMSGKPIEPKYIIWLSLEKQ